MATGTVHLYRVLRAPPQRVYRAFTTAEALVKWMPPHGFVAQVQHFDARSGGSFRMSFTNFTTEQSQAFGGEFQELIPNQRLRYTDHFDDPNLPGVIQMTVTLKAVSGGTELDILQEGIPETIPLEACYLGWQESLLMLAQLVEAEVLE